MAQKFTKLFLKKEGFPSTNLQTNMLKNKHAHFFEKNPNPSTFFDKTIGGSKVYKLFLKKEWFPSTIYKQT